MTEGTSQFMAGKRGLIMGVANDKSLAWGIAKTLAAQGAELAFTYQGDALKKRVEPLAASIGADFVVECDVATDESLDQAFEKLATKWDRIDFVVHAIGYANKDELKGEYLNTSRENFVQSLDISCYSFTAVSQRAAKLMPDGGSLLTLTYYGAVQVMPHYNLMGVAKAALETSVKYLAADLGTQNIRVNGLSAGPAKTLAASGIGDFRTILRWNELNAPLRRNITLDDVGKSALYLLSDLSSGVTGEIHYVDSGYHTVGMLATDAAGELSTLLGEYAERHK